MVDYAVCAVDYEFVAVFVGTECGAEDFQSFGIECSEDFGWGIERFWELC